MVKIFKILFALLFPLFVEAQPNLVPNWSFENILDCNPHNGGDLLKAPPWFAAQNFGSSTDLFNVCDTNYFHIPNNFLGFQYPHYGNGYAGFLPWQDVGGSFYYREYAEVKLVSSLYLNRLYCITFYINSSNSNTCYTSSIGAVFSYDSLLCESSNLLIDTVPDIVSNIFITDTLIWTRISGTYYCNSPVNFLTIGNFYDDTHTTFSSTPNTMYYYLDDVSVVEVSPADAGNDTAVCAGTSFALGSIPTFDAEYTWYELADSANSNSIDSIHAANPHVSPLQSTSYVLWKRQCNVVTMDTITVTVNCNGLQEQQSTTAFYIYPNPASGSVHVKYAGSATAIRICNVLGQVEKLVEQLTPEMDIDVSGLSSGVYFVSAMDRNKSAAIVKLIIQ